MISLIEQKPLNQALFVIGYSLLEDVTEARGHSIYCYHLFSSEYPLTSESRLDGLDRYFRLARLNRLDGLDR